MYPLACSDGKQKYHPHFFLRFWWWFRSFSFRRFFLNAKVFPSDSEVQVVVLERATPTNTSSCNRFFKSFFLSPTSKRPQRVNYGETMTKCLNIFHWANSYTDLASCFNNLNAMYMWSRPVVIKSHHQIDTRPPVGKNSLPSKQFYSKTPGNMIIE